MADVPWSSNIMHSGGWSKFPLITSPLPPACLPHWQSRHIWNNPQAIIVINKKKSPVYLVGTAVPMNARYDGKWGKKWERMKPWYSYKRMKSIWTKHISSFPPLLFSLFDALGKNNGSCTSECTGSTPCLVDNYRLAWHWHYQYLGKPLPNYVRRDRNLAVEMHIGEDRNVLGRVSEASDSPQLGNLLSRGSNLYIKGRSLAVASTQAGAS